MKQPNNQRNQPALYRAKKRPVLNSEAHQKRVTLQKGRSEPRDKLATVQVQVYIFSGKRLCLKSRQPWMLSGEKTDHSSLSSSFYHSYRRLVIEVEENNDHLFLNISVLPLSLCLVVCCIILTIPPPPFSTLSSHPHSQGESI